MIKNRLGKSILEELYVKQLLPMKEVSNQLSIPMGRIRRDLIYYGLTRTKTNAQILAFKLGRKFNNVSGELNPMWRGGRHKLSQTGYIKVLHRNHHRTDCSGYVYEHILVWEKTHNQQLPDGWIIHHLNGVQYDNRPENLVAMSRGEHIHQIEPFKKRIRELEIEIEKLKSEIK